MGRPPAQRIVAWIVGRVSSLLDRYVVEGILVLMIAHRRGDGISLIVNGLILVQFLLMVDR